MVFGGGIVGLWTAFEAARQGFSVALLEKRAFGAGASGGLLGALMPHQPSGWSAKKQFQLEGLLSLEEEIVALEALTGTTTGYRRCGRAMPIRHAQKQRQSLQWVDGSVERWPAPYRWRIEGTTAYPSWLPQAEMPFGSNADNLSARVSPRRLSTALLQALQLSGVEIRQGIGLRSIDIDGKLSLTDNNFLSAGHVVLCTGWETFALLEPQYSAPIGAGVKGQAALLRPVRPVDPAMPIVYDNGVYVIAHEDGSVAIGSTSENAFSNPVSTDDALDAVIARARALCPALEGAETVERWAGVRPKATGRDPLVGPLPGFRNVSVATGGFKISFAIAHLMAKAIVAGFRDEATATLPAEFRPENRLRLRSGSAP